MSPKIRQTIYYLGTIVPAILGIALVWGGIDAGSADNIAQIITGLLSFFSAGAPAVAAKKVSDQQKDGTLADKPVDKVVKGGQDVIANHQAATAELELVKNAVTGAVGIIPGIGPLAAQVINSFPTAYSQVADFNQKPWDR